MSPSGPSPCRQTCSLCRLLPAMRFPVSPCVLCISVVSPFVALLGVAVATSASANDATPQTNLYLRLSNLQLFQTRLLPRNPRIPLRPRPTLNHLVLIKSAERKMDWMSCKLPSPRPAVRRGHHLSGPAQRPNFLGLAARRWPVEI